MIQILSDQVKEMQKLITVVRELKLIMGPRPLASIAFINLRRLLIRRMI